jgi:uncharacterized protein (TIGR02145 family)
MKKILNTIILVVVTFVMAGAQVPHAFKYQALARDDAGNILINWEIGLKVSIIQVEKEVYVETHQVTTNNYGIIDIVIGKGKVQKGDFNDILWGQESHSIKIEMDINGGSDYREIATSQLYAVPYALYAEQAGKIADKGNETYMSTAKSQQPKAKNDQNNRNGTPNSKFPSDTSSYMNLNAGNLGVGTTDPQEKVDVNGNVKADKMVLVDENDNQWVMYVDTTGVLVLISKFVECGDSLYDYRDGKYYQTILIGTQCWFSESINVGLKIDKEDDQSDNDTIEKYCYNNNELNCDVLGGLYQWNEMMQYASSRNIQGICPPGWHLPSDGEWVTLTDFLGGLSVAGGKMKSTGTIEGGDGYWYATNDATNESGFTAHGSGKRDFSGGYTTQYGYYGYFWSSTEKDGTTSYYRSMTHNNSAVVRSYYQKTGGFAVRCLKD